MPRTKRVINNSENNNKTIKKTKKVKLSNNTVNNSNKTKTTNNTENNSNKTKTANNTENNSKKPKMTNKEVTTDSESNDDPDMMYNDSVENRIMNCVKDCNIFDDSTNKSRVNSRFTSRYPTEKDYQESFDDIISFRNSLTEKERNGIDVIMYNENNNDGMISAYIAWLYFKENKSNKLPIFVPAKPSSSNTMLNFRLKKHEPNLKDKTLLIVDISFGKANYEYLTRVCKNIIIVDDHKIQTKNNIATFINKFSNVKHFIGDTHSACSYVWKFFFPKKDVPYYIMVIDNKDKKLFLPFIPRLKSQYFTSYLSFRVTNSPYLNKNDPHYFDKVHKLLNVDSNYSSIVGLFYDQVENNIKDQIARYAQPAMFQGYRVYVLNYDDGILYKKIARQIMTNCDKRGEKVDFIVLWSYQYTIKQYRVFLSERHSGVPRYNLPEMAQKLAKIGGTQRGGLGKQYIGNFFWPHNDKMDIWDLFTKKYI
jgi:hypothetical protein